MLMQDWSDEAWNRIDALLDEALGRPPAERTAFLVEACPDDPALRQQVEALIAAEAAAPSFLEADAAALLTAASFSGHADDNSTHAGRQVGAYRLIEEIGRGGMSRVYRAERVDGTFEQQVAIKLLPFGLDTPAARHRFRVERQVLADLAHPNIARLLDGGVTDGGMPYLVMEQIEGSPITDYCDTHRLSIQERLALLVEVGKALQFAHRNLVVHRDLKPSNLLVTEAGQVKLLDFGIAKLLDASMYPVTQPITRTGVRLMTPAYAAPEQVRGDTISAATDVYQLGVLAYELLTGHRPFESEADSRFAMERAVLEAAPTRPSTIVTKEAKRPMAGPTQRVTPDAVSTARRLSIDRLRSRLRGDLDAIVLKALQKAPEQRYASVGAFIGDVGRYLDGRPVTARRVTSIYRIRRFIRRHQGGLAVATAFLLVISGAVALLMDQRNRAQRAAQTAEQVSAFLVGLFEASRPQAAAGDTVTARNLLRQGKQEVARLDDQPLVQAEMLDAMGRAYQGLGTYDTAQALLKQALELRRRALGSEHRDVAESLMHLADAFAEERDFEPALPRYRRALAVRREALGANHPKTAEALGGLAVALRNMEKPDSAVVLARRALAIHRRQQSRTHPAVIDAMHRLAYTLRAAGRYEQSAARYRQVLERAQARYGAGHARLAGIYNDLAYLRKQQGHYEAAERHYRQALKIRRATLGPAHPQTTLVMQNLAGTLWKQEEYGDVEVMLQKRVQALRAHAPSDSLRLGEALAGLARFYAERGRFRAAVAPMRSAYRRYRTHRGAAHLYTICKAGELGAILKALGRDAQADPLLARAYRALRARRDSILQHRDTYTRLNVSYALRAMILTVEQAGLTELAARYRRLRRSYQPDV